MNWNVVLNYAKSNPSLDKIVEKTASEWKALLSPEQFRITHQYGTEPALSGEYYEAHEPGIYACTCGGTELFDFTTKFNSRSGWPSFTKPVKEKVSHYTKDVSWGMKRIEVLRSVCYTSQITSEIC
jgi:peptide-methionine (R)-S-oxide reductase